MAFDALSQRNKNPYRFMIITGDENIIEQIQNNKNLHLMKSVLVEDEEEELSPPPDEYTKTQKRIKTGSLICVVCGSPALGYNFDAITCESCKAFFRRNALKDPKSLNCRRNGDCEVTNETRRRCSACRLTKCLTSGMKRERLQRAEERAAKRRLLEENRILTSQNNLLLNGSKLSNTQHFLNHQSQGILLTKEDAYRIEAIRSLYERRIEFATRDGLPWDPSANTVNILQHINSRSVPALRLIAFFRRIPEFNQLNVDDKVILTKYNLLPLSILNGSLFYRKETDQVIETDADVPWDLSTMKKLYGDEIFYKARRIFHSFVFIAQCDQKIIQIALIIFILSKGSSIDLDGEDQNLNDSHSVYRAQSFYTELLWKYMEATYGFKAAESMLTKLIFNFIAWQTMEKQARLLLKRAVSSTNADQLLPVMKSLLCIS